MIDLTASENSVHGVVNDADQPIIKRGGYLTIPALHGQDQRLVVETFGVIARSRRDQAKGSGAGRSRPRHGDS